MKTTILVCTVLLGYVVAAPQYTAEYFKVHQECQADSKYLISDMTVFQELEYEKKKPSEVKIPSNFNDHMFCMYNKLGIVDDKGKINESVAVDKLKSFFEKPSSSATIVAECSASASASTGAAAVSGAFYFCLLESFA
ncbi:uncharacterized protein LOC132699292 isoform X1 [Cylas formicarius]|uniref:Odorant binding protein 33 n=1 Tax=Cylas formicarius TaxID=197179 RepID=A0A8T9EPB4_CYLFO|nr:uncharacterized protein LOC132699292 isoform X1 [Cylas formicarius]UNA06117.1 odorant binding protein 33 [Cylas formicarius]